jgi:hypothetical protein
VLVGGGGGLRARFERGDFIINLKTAQALGLTIPEHVLLQATEVIQ